MCRVDHDGYCCQPLSPSLPPMPNKHMVNDDGMDSSGRSSRKKLRKKNEKEKTNNRSSCVLYAIFYTFSHSLSVSSYRLFAYVRSFIIFHSRTRNSGIVQFSAYLSLSLTRSLSQMMKRWLKSRSLVFYSGDSWYVFVFVGNVWIWNNVTPRATFKFSQSLNCIRWQHMNIYIRILCASRAGKSNFFVRLRFGDTN